MWIETDLRRPTFVEGREVILADGQAWSLPARDADRADPEYDAMLRMVAESEDRSERLRSELALTIFLLGRNYRLSPRAYQALLEYPPGDPSLDELQRSVNAFAREQIRKLMPTRPDTPRAGRPKLLAFWSMFSWLRAYRMPRLN